MKNALNTPNLPRIRAEPHSARGVPVSSPRDLGAAWELFLSAVAQVFGES